METPAARIICLFPSVRLSQIVKFSGGGWALDAQGEGRRGGVKEGVPIAGRERRDRHRPPYSSLTSSKTTRGLWTHVKVLGRQQRIRKQQCVSTLYPQVFHKRSWMLTQTCRCPACVRAYVQRAALPRKLWYKPGTHCIGQDKSETMASRLHVAGV